MSTPEISKAIEEAANAMKWAERNVSDPRHFDQEKHRKTYATADAALVSLGQLALPVAQQRSQAELRAEREAPERGRRGGAGGGHRDVGHETSSVAPQGARATMGRHARLPCKCPRVQALVKVLGVGEVTRAVTVSAHKFSATAKAKIEAAGGTCVELKSDWVSTSEAK